MVMTNCANEEGGCLGYRKLVSKEGWVREEVQALRWCVTKTLPAKITLRPSAFPPAVPEQHCFPEVLPPVSAAWQVQESPWGLLSPAARWGAAIGSPSERYWCGWFLLLSYGDASSQLGTGGTGTAEAHHSGQVLVGTQHLEPLCSLPGPEEEPAGGRQLQ